MKILIPGSFLAFTVGIGGVIAAPIDIDAPSGIGASDSTLSRAEVLADLEVWRQAGPQDFHRGTLAPDTGSDQYRRAFAAYQRLRYSPQFALLVQKFRALPVSSLVARPASFVLVRSSDRVPA